MRLYLASAWPFLTLPVSSPDSISPLSISAPVVLWFPLRYKALGHWPHYKTAWGSNRKDYHSLCLMSGQKSCLRTFALTVWQSWGQVQCLRCSCGLSFRACQIWWTEMVYLLSWYRCPCLWHTVSSTHSGSRSLGLSLRSPLLWTWSRSLPDWSIFALIVAHLQAKWETLHFDSLDQHLSILCLSRASL